MEKPDANVHHFKHKELLRALDLARGADDYLWSVRDGIICQELDAQCLVEYVAGQMLDPSVREAVIRAAVLEEKQHESAG